MLVFPGYPRTAERSHQEILADVSCDVQPFFQTAHQDLLRVLYIQPVFFRDETKVYGIDPVRFPKKGAGLDVGSLQAGEVAVNPVQDGLAGFDLHALDRRP